MFIYILSKCWFSEFRDAVVKRIQSEGITWSAYGVSVREYSLDAQVKFIRLLGVNLETDASENTRVFKEVGIGDVIEIKKIVPDFLGLQTEHGL